MNRLIEKVTLSKLDGSYIKLLNHLERQTLIILDDFGRCPPVKFPHKQMDGSRFLVEDQAVDGDRHITLSLESGRYPADIFHTSRLAFERSFQPEFADVEKGILVLGDHPQKILRTTPEIAHH